MLLMLIVLAVMIGTGAGLALTIVRLRYGHRRRLSRARRVDEYAARQSDWQSYIGPTPPNCSAEERAAGE